MRVGLDRSGLPLVGRARELAAISAAIESAQTGNGTLLTIIGDAGMGKTRLAAEAMRRARAAGFACAWGSGWADGGSPPLWPWPDIVEQLGAVAAVNVVPGSLAPVDDLAQMSVDVAAEDVDAERFARFRSVCRAIARSSELGPVMIVIDNAQAADAGALLLARFVIRSLPAAPVLFVITSRPPTAEAADVAAAVSEIARDGVVLRPAPLSVGVLREMFHELGRTEPDHGIAADRWIASDRWIDEVHRLTGGNPLFVNELIASSEPGRPIEARSVRSIMELRMRQLSADQQRTLRVVAVLGQFASAPLVAEVDGTGRDEASAALDAAVDTGVLVRLDDGCHVFAHDLLADAALASGPPTERASLHDRAARCLLAETTLSVDRASAGARHRLAHARLTADRESIVGAGHSCLVAAAMLIRRLAYESAAVLLAESIELQDQSGLEVAPEMLLAVARAELASGNLRGARPWFWRAAESADSPERLAEAAVGLGGIWVDEHRNTIDHAAFMALIERAVDGLRGSNRPDLLARLEVRRAAEHVYLGQAPLRAVSEAVERARAVGDPLVLAEVLSLQMHTMLGPASAGRRQEITEQLVEAANLAGDEVLAVMGALWRTVHRLLVGDPRAERSLQELRERADALQISAILFVIAAIDVMRLLRRGLIVEAELAVQLCFELGTSIGDADAVGYYGAHLMSIRWLQGDAAAILPLAREVANSPTLVDGDLTYPAAVAVLAAMAGETDEARAALGRVMGGANLGASSSSSNWMMWMFCIAECAAVLGAAAEARTVYGMLLPFRDQPMIGSLGVACFGSAERSLGIAARTFGDLDLAQDHLERAIVADRTLGNDVLLAITSGELGRLLVERGLQSGRTRGRVLIESAITALDEFGLALRAEQLRAFADANSSEPIGELIAEPGTWTLRFGNDRAVLADTIGVRRLVQLLERPFIDVAVGDLIGGLDQTSRQELMDSAALRSYRDRVAELNADIDEADQNNDIVRAERLRTELDTLLEHISAGASLGQRSRQFTSSQERARVAVRKSLTRVFDDIAAQSPRLAALLVNSVRTGNICRFDPYDPLPAIWRRA